MSSAGLPIDKVFIEVRTAAGDVRASQLADFPADQSQVSLTLKVRLTATREPLFATIELRSGATPIFSSKTPVTLWQSQTTVAKSNPLTYVGPGAAATLLKVQPSQATVAQTGSQQFAAIALAANQSSVSDLPITGWTSSDPTVATVTPAGLVHGLRSGTVTITAHALNLLLGAASLHVVGLPSRIAVLNGGAQRATVAATLTQPFQVQVLSAAGEGVPGVAIEFQPITTGGSVGTTVATTDVEGIASTTATVGIAAGPYEFRAVISGVGSGGPQPASITATAEAGAAATIAKISGDAQSGTSGEAVAAPLVVRVTDAYGNPVSGARVTFTRLTGTGAISSATGTTGADGLATTTYTLGTATGNESVRADVAGLTDLAATFILTSNAGPPSAVAAPTGDGIHLTVSAAPSAPLVALVTDSHGNPVPSVTVTWRIASGPGSLSSDHSVTDAAGEASVSFTSDGHAGTIVVTATAGESSKNFTIVVDAGPASRMSIVTGTNNQSAAAGSALAVAPSVRLTDNFDNPVSGVSVTFTPIAGSGSVVHGSATTGASGVARAGGLTGGSAAGAQTLNVAAGSFSASFAATALPTLAIAMAGSGSGTVSSQPEGIACTLSSVGTSGTCRSVTALDQVVTLTATSGANGAFEGFSGVCAGKNPCLVTMSQSQAIIATFSLRTWSVMSIPTTAPLHGIWDSSPSQIFAVGGGGTVLEFDGSNWTSLTNGATGGDLWDAWGTSASDLYSASGALSQPGQLVHFDGGAWSAAPAATTASLHGVWGTSATNIYVCGDRGTLLHYDGNGTWTSIPTGTTSLLFTIWGSAPNDIYIVGLNGTALHFDGQAVTQISLPNLTVEPNGATEALGAVWGSSATDVWIGGGFTSGDVWHYDGTAWEKSTIWNIGGSTSQGVNGLWGTSSSDIWAVGQSSAYHYDGSNWTPSVLPVGSATLLRVWGTGSFNVFATGLVGSSGVILRYR